MRTITADQITDLIAQAGQSPRRRAIYRLHEHEEPVQRMVNALHPGTYITPHQHGNPPKVELIAILRGRVVVVHFDSQGTLLDAYLLDADGPLKAVDIAPGEFHNMIALEPAAVLEIVQGPYDPATHKQFASFAPAEGAPDCDAYLLALLERVEDHLDIDLS